MAGLREAQQRAAEVSELLSKGSYYGSREALVVLENFVNDQVAHPSLYSIGCNLAILKEYLIFPKLFRLDVVRLILVKALMHLPSTDFDTCLCQIPLPYQETDTVIRSLIASERLLQTCKFSEFWALLGSNPELAAAVDIPDFKNSIRRFMAGVVSLTYKTITMGDVAKLLNLDVKELEAFCETHLNKRWTCDASASPDGVVTIAKEGVTLLAQKAPARSLFATETLADCLASVRSIAQHAE